MAQGSGERISNPIRARMFQVMFMCAEAARLVSCWLRQGRTTTAEQMAVLDDFVSFLFSSPTSLLGAAAPLLVFYVVFSRFISKAMGREPPGPRPLPLLGNLLQLDLQRPYKTLCEVCLRLLMQKKAIL